MSLPETDAEDRYLFVVNVYHKPCTKIGLSLQPEDCSVVAVGEAEDCTMRIWNERCAETYPKNIVQVGDRMVRMQVGDHVVCKNGETD